MADQSPRDGQSTAGQSRVAGGKTGGQDEQGCAAGTQAEAGIRAPARPGRGLRAIIHHIDFALDLAMAQRSGVLEADRCWASERRPI
jgi:hypothetical protein